MAEPRAQCLVAHEPIEGITHPLDVAGGHEQPVDLVANDLDRTGRRVVRDDGYAGCQGLDDDQAERFRAEGREHRNAALRPLLGHVGGTSGQEDALTSTQRVDESLEPYALRAVAEDLERPLGMLVSDGVECLDGVAETLLGDDPPGHDDHGFGAARPGR